MKYPENYQEVLDLLADLECKLFYASIREDDEFPKVAHQLVKKALLTWYHKEAQE